MSPAALKVRALRPKSVLFAQGPCFRAEHSVPRGAIAARNGARAQGTMPQATKVGARPRGRSCAGGLRPPGGDGGSDESAALAGCTQAVDCPPHGAQSARVSSPHCNIEPEVEDTALASQTDRKTDR